MDLTANTAVWGCGLSPSYHPQLGKSFSPLSSPSSLCRSNLKRDSGRFGKWVCCCSVLARRATTPVEDGKPLKSMSDNTGIDRTVETESTGFYKDLSALPKPLTATDLSYSPGDGSKVRVAYQGVPGSYSEDAALKAYPKCETVPCDEFEAAFQALELWLVDKAVLPIESTLGGSIHRNYDLLLRHRLHIVAEVQLAVDHCLLALPVSEKRSSSAF